MTKDKKLIQGSFTFGKTAFAIQLLWMTLLVNEGRAQFTFDHSNYQKGQGFVTDVKGRKSDADPYSRVINGSPWWRENWNLADLADGTGRIFRNIQVKIDLVADKVFYKDSSGAVFELLTPVMYLRAFPTGTPDTIKLVQAEYFKSKVEISQAGWMQLHILGEATLLQELDKVMNENQVFGSAVTEYTIANKNSWVVVLESKVYTIKKTKELLELLSARKPAMRQYVLQQKGMDAQVQELVLAFNGM